MSIEDNPCRVVRTKDSEVALLGHGLETDGDILYEFLHDSQTNKVSIQRSSKARYGKEYVEANESIQPLIDYANTVHSSGTPPVEEDTSSAEISKPSNTGEEIPEWQKEGFSSKAEWKQAHKGN